MKSREFTNQLHCLTVASEPILKHKYSRLLVSFLFYCWISSFLFSVVRSIMEFKNMEKHDTQERETHGAERDITCQVQLHCTHTHDILIN